MGLALDPPLILAPMAGVTDRDFRLIVRRIGGVGLVQGNDTPDQFLTFTAEVTDGDGDTSSASWDIGIDGTGQYHDGEVSGIDII